MTIRTRYIANAMMVIIAGVTCSACASLTSQPEAAVAGNPVSASAGLPYYLPRRPILLSIVVTAAADKTTGKGTLSASAGTMEPDLKHRFTLRYGQNYLGTNAINVTANSKGLLVTANTSVTSSIGQIATNAGSVIGALTGAAAVAGPAPGPPCDPGQTYNYVYYPKAGTQLSQTLACGITVDVSRVSADGAPSPQNDSLAGGVDKSKPGIFFRQELPYEIVGRDSAGNVVGQWILYSPNESDTFFYPVSRTIFAGSHTNFTLAEGVVTGVDQTSDSELNGILQTPANWLNGYATALGQVFTNFNTGRSDREAAAVSKTKFQYCQAVIAANSLSGKTGADLTTAETNIKAACQ